MDHEPTVGLADLARFLQGGFLTAVTVATLFTAVAFVATSMRPPSFSSSSVLVAAAPVAGDDTTVVAPRLILGDYGTAATSDAVLRAALVDLSAATSDGASDPGAINAQAVEALRQRIKVETQDPSRSGTITIEARGRSASGVAQVANAVATALLNWDAGRANQALEASISSFSTQITALEEQIRAFQVQPDTTGAEGLAAKQALLQQKAAALSDLLSRRDSGRSALTMLRPAAPPLAPSSPSTAFVSAVALLLGLFVGYGLVLVRGMLTPRIRDIRELAFEAHVPVVADIKVPLHRLSPTYPIRPATASYLRAFLELTPPASGPHLIVGSHERAGQLAVALAVGLSFARGGKSVLWIDTGVDDVVRKLGAVVMNASPYTLEDHLRVRQMSLPPHELRTGSLQPLHLMSGLERVAAPADLASQAMPRLLQQGSEAYDVVLVTTDSPAQSPMALVVAPHCGRSLLVADLLQSSRDDIRRSVELLRECGLELAGAVATHGAPRVPRPSQRTWSALVKAFATNRTSREAP